MARNRWRKKPVDPEKFKATVDALAAYLRSQPPRAPLPSKTQTEPRWGGQHQKTTEEYHAVPTGWSADEILAAHARLGGSFDLRPTQIPQHYAPWFHHKQVIRNIAAGIAAGDAASVELAIRYIEARFIVSYSGYLRCLLARRLKHVVLSEEHRARLSRHFSKLLRSGERCSEFAYYIAVWRGRISEAELADLEEFLKTVPATDQEFAHYLMNKLRPKPALKPNARAPSGRRLS